MESTATLLIRPFRCDDANACLALFRDCVLRINSRDYTDEQIRAWVPPNIDLEVWQARFADRFAYVVTEADTIVGFTDMTRDGYIDRLFVSADHQRRGIARRLVDRLLSDADAYSIQEVTTDASITAKPFFQRMGFGVVREQSVDCRGVRMTNYRMRRPF